MKTIHKIELKNVYTDLLVKGTGVKFLSVQMQYNIPVVWFEIRPNAHHTTALHFEMFGTGRNLDTKGEYIGTVQTGELVWHIYGRTSE